MTATFEELLRAATSLPEQERIDLVDAIVATLEVDESDPLDESQRREVKHRASEMKAGLVAPVPWSAVEEKLRQVSEKHARNQRTRERSSGW